MTVDALTNFLQSYNIPFIPIVATLLIILTGYFLHLILFSILRKFSRNKKSADLSIFIKKLEAPARALTILFSLMVSLPLIDIINTQRVSHMLSLVLILFITWFIIKSFATLRTIILHRHDLAIEDNLSARKIYTQFRMLERILVTIVIIIAVATALMTFEKIRQVGVSMLASAGIAGIILGFAAQRSIATIIAGFQIAITQPIRIDDVILIEGEFGWVEEITLTYVTVRVWDKRRIIVPITFFIENPFQNWTRTSADLLGTVFIFTDYTVPVDALREELSRLLESNSSWDKKVNVIQVTDAREKTIEIRALVSAASAPALWDLRVYVREKLIIFLQENYPEALPKSRVELKESNS